MSKTIKKINNYPFKYVFKFYYRIISKYYSFTLKRQEIENKLEIKSNIYLKKIPLIKSFSKKRKTIRRIKSGGII